MQIFGGGIIDITHNALAGDQLSIRGGNLAVNLDNARASLDLVPSRNVAATATGNDFLTASIAGPQGISIGYPASTLAVNLVDNSNLHGNFSVGLLASLTISGGDKAKYIHDGTDTLAGGAHEVVTSKVVGTGEFILSASRTKPAFIGSNLEFGGFVSGDQTIDITGNAFGGGIYPALSSLRVDEPTQFHGLVDLHNYSLADLVGLAQTDRWTYEADMLSIKSASGKVIDQLHVLSDASTTGSVHGLSVSMSTTGDIFVGPRTDFHGSFASTMT